MSADKVTYLPRGRKPDLGYGGMVDTITGAIEAFGAHNIDPTRPFTGQPHTDQGERGKQEVKGLRMRDLCDCLAVALVQSTGPDAPALYSEKIENRTLTYNDLYSLDLHDIDPIAIIQNLTCEVEKVMGIYPNIPELTYGDEGPGEGNPSDSM